MCLFLSTAVRRDNVETPNLQDAANLANHDPDLRDQVRPHRPRVNDDSEPRPRTVSEGGNPQGDPGQGSELPPPRDEFLGRHVGQHQLGRHFHEQDHGQVQARPGDVQPGVRIDPSDDQKTQRQDGHGDQPRGGLFVFRCDGQGF
eukprot:CAMPEP_0201130362 /NCGR_PEP_ID=MMETSP0850-20130426/39634_1 /ASSEMBLY_ACC=CAM_ASM_000622 /TAXON_ID=183588 /ORGANISM="Pseudo-nitzschia fraudulenta, Strain WWA7" /LENGTH=144 /DNA_ID=CAMNT_0047400109 /DNA_START=448 /DNA_END=882 /DNA_ORIENTATION=-